MPPRVRFERQEIIEAAFALAKTEGLDAITARRVAAALGSSVAPLYAQFTTIDHLVEAVVQHTLGISQEFLEREQRLAAARDRQSSTFEVIGRASLAFAREYPVLMRELVLKPNPWLPASEQQDQQLIDLMGDDPELADWDRDERKRLLLQMRAFQLGLTLMTVNQQVPDWAHEIDLEELLMETGAELVLARQQSNNRREQ
ncbi:TetR/AcrR family transcriptional regulator [Spirochaeta africana]|uniref:Transcriptional regulator n=1 Tax=Spirochaeta africana (strain ATCC 700263 / DSM 8902 / Z-7692) TaxID=889378 RepID=H9UHJ1_SPIAZ|nr:TetR family transcriptional regulator [Spirochaeta africana]AFG36984.1 transcriptional regulator [Spirochaeta africana DSM 8902]